MTTESQLVQGTAVNNTIAFASAEVAKAFSLAPITPYVAASTHCECCGLRNLCLPADLTLQAIRSFASLVGNRMRLKKRDSLYRPGDPFDAVYAVRLGTFKTVMLAEDGREQITGFFMGGEILGAEGISQGHHRCEAIALEDSEVCVLPFNLLEKLAREVPALAHNISRLISQDLCRSQDMMFLLGSMRAKQRLVTYLLNLAARYQARGYSGTEFVLRMSREEIASMLGLKLETVSRVCSNLQADGLIQVQGRSVRLLDLAGLKDTLGKQSGFKAPI